MDLRWLALLAVMAADVIAVLYLLTSSKPDAAKRELIAESRLCQEPGCSREVWALSARQRCKKHTPVTVMSMTFADDTPKRTAAFMFLLASGMLAVTLYFMQWNMAHPRLCEQINATLSACWRA